jgi:hypothetical protein
MELKNRTRLSSNMKRLRRIYLFSIFGPTKGTVRCDPVLTSSRRKGAHGHFIFLGHIRQCQLSVDRETLLERMTAKQLEFRTDDALPGQLGDELVSEQMRVHPLLDASSLGILGHDLPDAPGGVRPVAIGFEEIRHALQALTFEVRGELSSKAGGKEHLPIFVALPLANAELAGVEPHLPDGVGPVRHSGSR